MPTRRQDAERVARRFHETWPTVGLPYEKRTHEPWEDLPVTYRRQLVRTIDELMRAEVIFAGPSLYADP